jgi:hypothetical protein
MGNFYNPYMKSADIGQGVSGTISEIMQMMALKKMLEGDGSSSSQLGPTALPQSNMGGQGAAGLMAGMGKQAQAMNPQAMAGLSGQAGTVNQAGQGNQVQQLLAQMAQDPALKAKIMSILSGLGSKPGSGMMPGI